MDLPVSHKAENDQKQPCLYCGSLCDAEFVDVGFGYALGVQCSPYYCEACHALEIHPDDKRLLTEREKETCWYEPHTPVSEKANTVSGVLVDTDTARFYYLLGMLDKKQ